MFSPANATVIPLEKDPATMTVRELFDHIQYLKRAVMKRADQRNSVDPTTLSEQVHQSLAAIAESDREELAKLLPVEEELRHILGLQ